MDFEVYCDESHPELFTSGKPTARFLMIGSLWLPADIRDEIKEKIWTLRQEHDTWGEMKWRKVNQGKLAFYNDIVDLFFGYGKQLRFRCIAIDREFFDRRWHDNDDELGFYKFYYQLLHHWILDFNSYRVFCDVKKNRDLKRLSVLRDCLHNANISSRVHSIQALPSRQVVLIQLADLFLGMVSARLNNTLSSGSVKERLVLRLERHLGATLAPTPKSVQKFNIFKINLRGGW